MGCCASAVTREDGYAAVAPVEGGEEPPTAPRPVRRRGAGVGLFLRKRAFERGFRVTVNGCDVAYARGSVTVSYSPVGAFDLAHVRTALGIIDRLVAIDQPYHLRIVLDEPRFPRLSDIAVLRQYKRMVGAVRTKWMDAHITELHVHLHGHRALLPVMRQILSILPFQCPVRVE